MFMTKATQLNNQTAKAGKESTMAPNHRAVYQQFSELARAATQIAKQIRDLRSEMLRYSGSPGNLVAAKAAADEIEDLMMDLGVFVDITYSEVEDRNSRRG